jgi:hypothetical protein
LSAFLFLAAIVGSLVPVLLRVAEHGIVSLRRGVARRHGFMLTPPAARLPRCSVLTTTISREESLTMGTCTPAIHLQPLLSAHLVVPVVLSLLPLGSVGLITASPAEIVLPELP